MGRTSKDLTPSELELYQQAWRNRQLAETAALQEKARAAYQVATQAACLLKGELGVKRVWLFGSLARGTFGVRSDIDLAVEGLDPSLLYKTVGRLQGLNPEFEIDLIPIEEARPSIRESIITEGILL